MSAGIPMDALFNNTKSTQCLVEHLENKLPYQYQEAISKGDITDWALEQFQNHYKQAESSSPVCYAGSSELREEFKMADNSTNNITKEAIFHYVYAVLHDFVNCQKSELNLKKEFPRIPFYDNFWQWSNRGEQLKNLHIN